MLQAVSASISSAGSSPFLTCRSKIYLYSAPGEVATVKHGRPPERLQLASVCTKRRTAYRPCLLLGAKLAAIAHQHVSHAGNGQWPRITHSSISGFQRARMAPRAGAPARTRLVRAPSPSAFGGTVALAWVILELKSALEFHPSAVTRPRSFVHRRRPFLTEDGARCVFAG
jgi:hypothetical protein